MKVLPVQPDLTELLRRLSAPSVPVPPRGEVVAGGRAIPKEEAGKSAVLPNLAAALRPALPSTSQPTAGFAASPNVQLLLDAVAGNRAAEPSREQATPLGHLPAQGLALRAELLPGQRPATISGHEPEMSRAREHGAEKANRPVGVEPQRMTEQFWRSDVQPHVEARRELSSKLEEQAGAALLPPQQPPTRGELGTPPGLQLLAALQAGLNTAPRISAGNIGTKPLELASKSRSKMERRAGEDVPELSGQVLRRSYLIAATVAALIALLALARSCSGF